MTHEEKLRDLIALSDALRSERKSLIRSANSRSWRSARVRNAIRAIRNAHSVIGKALAEINTLRNRDALYASLEALDLRIAELNASILRQRKLSKLIKLRALQEQITALNTELPDEFKVAFDRGYSSDNDSDSDTDSGDDIDDQDDYDLDSRDEDDDANDRVVNLEDIL